MTKKDVECQVHTWMIKKAKKPWYIKRGKTEGKGTEKKRKKRKIRSLGHVRRGFIATYHARILDLFTQKCNILAQDQTSFLSCTL